jgi:hypothetical protein
MGERSLTECLEEQLRFARDHLRAAEMTVQDFYDSGQDFEAIADKLDDLQRESLAHAWGYLEGAADALDLTVLELVEAHGLSFDAPAHHKRQLIRKPRRKVVDGVTLYATRRNGKTIWVSVPENDEP